MAAPLVGVAPIFALSFFGNDLGKNLLKSHPNQDLSVAQLSAAGGFSGILTTIIMAPGERIKCILQVRHLPKKWLELESLHLAARYCTLSSTGKIYQEVARFVCFST